MRRKLSRCVILFMMLILTAAYFVTQTSAAAESGMKLYHKGDGNTTEYSDCTWEYGETFDIYDELVLEEKANDGSVLKHSVSVDSISVSDGDVLKLHDKSQKTVDQLIKDDQCPFCGSDAEIVGLKATSGRWYMINCTESNCIANTRSEWLHDDVKKANDPEYSARWRITVRSAGDAEVTVNYTMEGGEKGSYTYEITAPLYHTVTFRYYDRDSNEVIYDTQHVADGKSAVKPEGEPLKDGYVFSGWDTDFSNVTSDMTIEALWEEGFIGFKIISRVNDEETIWDCDENGVLTVSGTGSAELINADDIDRLEFFKTKIKKIIIKEGITAIGDNIFEGCTSVEEVVLQDGVEIIKAEAFKGCESLRKIRLTADIVSIEYNAFNGCTGMTEIEIPEGVSKIRAGAFSGCSSLKKVLLPWSLWSIETGVFEGCPEDCQFHVYEGSTADRYISANKVYREKDTEPPEVLSLTIDKTEVLRGDKVKFQMIAYDKDGVTGTPYIDIRSPNGSEVAYFDRVGTDEDDDFVMFECSVVIDKHLSAGLCVTDRLGGLKDKFGNEIKSSVIKGRFPESYFTVYDDPEYLDLPVYDDVTVYYNNEKIKNRTIEGDLYIGEDAHVTLQDVTVTGDIYVMGGLNAVSVNADTIRAKRFEYGKANTYPPAGRVYVSGSGTVNSYVTCDDVLKKVPLKLCGEIKSIDGKLDVKGVTVDIADMRLNRSSVHTVNGKFILKDYDVSDADTLVFTWESIYGKDLRKEYVIDKYVTCPDGSLDALPVIKADDKTYCIGSDIDYMADVCAEDKEDGDLTDNIKVDHTAVDTEQAGQYKVVYSVEDNSGGIRTKTVNINIVAHSLDSGKVILQATCEDEGIKEFSCKNCDYKIRKSIEAWGHYWLDFGEEIVAPTCEVDGEEIFECTDCGKTRSEVIPATGHSWSKYFTVDKKATCTEPGSKSRHCKNKGCSKKTEVTEIEATGHTNVVETTTEGTFFKPGSVITKCMACNTVLSEERIEYQGENLRIAGSNRYATSTAAADALKQSLGVDKFENIIVASGADYPDALAGSYLAKVKNAPVMLVGKDTETEADVKQYISKNLKKGGTVYLLGGMGVVTSRFEAGVKKLKDSDGNAVNVERLGGQTRYDTNIAILKAAGVDKEDLLVCTGEGFADSLSASAVGKPILLVAGSGVDDTQKKYLSGLKINDIYLIGGPGVVDDKIGTQLKEYDQDSKCERVAGQNRYLTSVAVAKEFFPDGAGSAVLAYAMNFPDGLAGGPLALSIKAPLILTDNSGYSDAVAYAKSAGIKRAAVLGGASLISDNIVNKMVE